MRQRRSDALGLAFALYGPPPARDVRARPAIGAPSDSPAAVDPRRVLRALQLAVELVGPRTYRVAGGARPHLVHPRPWRCDCADPARPCKHLLAVYLHRRLAPSVLAALRAASAAALGGTW